MLRFATVLLTATLAACSAQDDSSSVADSSAHDTKTDTAKDATAPRYRFFVDHRPVDGALRDVQVVKNDAGTYDVTMNTKYYDRMSEAEIDKTDTLGMNLECLESVSSEARLVELFCSVDKRPVDGALTEVYVADLDRNGEFEATLRTVHYDRINGRVVDETTILASDLAKVPSPVLQMCTQNAGVLVDPKTGICQGYTNGCQEQELRQQGYTNLVDGQGC